MGYLFLDLEMQAFQKEWFLIIYETSLHPYRKKRKDTIVAGLSKIRPNFGKTRHDSVFTSLLIKSGMSADLPRFISEKEVTERRLRNEAQGIKEEPYDPRSLYDRLQAEKARKQEEYETNAAFKNQIHRLDPDEAEFLAKVEQKKYSAQELAEHEADMLIREAKAANRSVLIKASTERSTSNTVPRRPTPSSSSSALDQRRLMSGIKRSSISNSDRHPKRAHAGSPEPNELLEQVEINPKVTETEITETAPVEARILAGYLPGLDAYTGSSSDSSSDSSTDVEDSAQTLDVIAMTRTKSASSGGE